MKRKAPSPAWTPTSFDAEQPAAFYLLDDREGLESLSDATLVVQDVELPVHSQVLSLQSKVLLNMFTAVKAPQPSGHGSQAKPVLTETFSGYDLFEVALFLRFIYRPIVLTPDNLVAVRGSLLGLLRLAHQLDVPQLVEAVLKEMSNCVDMAAPQAELLSWAEAAEQCCLPELRLRCLTEVARRLAHGGDSLAATFSATAELAKGCDHSTLSMLLGLLAAGCGPTGAPRVAEITPAAGAKALEASSKYGSFEWVVERYSQLPAAVGQNAYSPYFRAAGIDWRFKVYPGGNKAEAAGHISVFIVPKEGNITAKYSIAIVDQGPSKADLQTRSNGSKLFEAGTSCGWGWARFATAEQLHSQSHGYLKGDRLVLRASVEVTRRDVQPMAE